MLRFPMSGRGDGRFGGWMATVRTVILWVVLATIALLAVLSIVGAFLGADRATVLFTSVPLAVFWALVALLLAAGFVFYRRLIRSPSALAMHLGSLLIVLGAMWGSQKGHDLRRVALGSDKIASGFMVIQEGYAENRILRKGTTEVIGELPFSLYLEDFRIEYYPPKVPRWGLVVTVPAPDAAGKAVDEQQAEIPWEVGRQVEIPFTRAHVKVLQYLESAAPTYEKDAAAVVEIAAGDKTVTLAARAGAEVDLADPAMKVRVTKVFENLRVVPSPDGRQVVDAPGEGVNPAVEVELVRPDGTRDRRYLMALMPMHGRGDGPEMTYALPPPTGARPDPSSGVPAMEVLLECDGREHREWLLPRKGDPYVGLSLATLVTGAPEPEGAEGHRGPAMFLVAPRGEIRAYKSDLVVMEDGKPVDRKVLEVNDPLLYPAPWPPWNLARLARWWRVGGYHFYQADYDHEGERYTVLQVVSDSGLAAAYVGFFLLVGGTFGRFWIENPIRARRKAQGARGD